MGAPDHAAADAFRLIDALWADHFAPKIPQDVDDWADANRFLPAGSAESGRWQTSRTPYAHGIYKALSDGHECEDVVLMCATQLVKSEAGLNWIGWIIDEMPAPVMIVQATEKTGKRYSYQRVAPMISGSPVLRKKVAKAQARDASNSVSMKSFAGGELVITGANSASGLASMPAKYIHFDEVDDYPEDVEGQGDPISVAQARQDTFRRRKRLKTSSPKQPKGQSQIERLYLEGNQQTFHVACPHCDHRQALVWAHLKYLKNDEGVALPKTARYACEACGVLIEEHHKANMLANGIWVAKHPGRPVQSFHLNSLYSPMGWLSWSDLVVQWVAAQADLAIGKDEKYKAFVNTRLAETVAEQAEQLAANDLKKYAENYPLGIVPMGGLIVCVGVDIQDDRIEAFAWAFGELDQMWFVDRVVLMGNPGDDATWAMLDSYLMTRYKHASGASLPIEAVAIDTGGHYTHNVYNFVRRAHPARKIAAIRGDNHKPGIPILGKKTDVDVNFKGGIIKGGCKLWSIGVNTAKDLLHNRLKKPGQVHISQHASDEIFDQLVSEKRVSQRTARGTRFMWVKTQSNVRNEALDGTVYAMWCAERLGLDRYPQKVWDSIRERVQPRVGSLFDQPVSVEIETPAAAAAAEKKPVAKKPRPISMPRKSLLGQLRNR
jgi:phage terminase large subunit GpA-like protein